MVENIKSPKKYSHEKVMRKKVPPVEAETQLIRCIIRKCRPTWAPLCPS